MIVEDLRLDDWNDTCEISARIRESQIAEDGQRVWFRFPAELRPDELDGSPFVPAFVQACMALDEPLTIDAPVSPRLLEGAEGAKEVYRGFYGQLRDRDPRIEVAEAREPPATGREAACFFTRGVDSWYSVLNGLPGAPGALDPPIGKLIFAPTSDYFAGRPSPPRARKMRAEATELTREAADAVGCQLVVADSNVRELVEPVRNWGHTHGALLASIGLAMSPGLARVHIAGTMKVGNLVPLGSHPDLDPLWSTAATEVVHDGADMNRFDKIRWLADHPVALERLKVCINQSTDTDCGYCGKCVRTQIGLQIAGALDRGPRFDEPLSFRNIAGAVPEMDLSWAMFRDCADAVKSAGGHRGIRAAMFASKVRAVARQQRAQSRKRRRRPTRLSIRPRSSVR